MENKIYKFNDKTYQEHKAKFEEYDIKKQGYININEIDETKVEIFKGMDLDNDGKVDLSDFISYHEKILLNLIKKKFKEHDYDGDGEITESDLFHAFGLTYYAAEIKCYDLDLNGDGKVTFEDFASNYFNI